MEKQATANHKDEIKELLLKDVYSSTQQNRLNVRQFLKKKFPMRNKIYILVLLN